MRTLAKILDSATNELSEALKIIWQSMKRGEGCAKPEKLKRHIDFAQETLLDLMLKLEDFDKNLAITHYYAET